MKRAILFGATLLLALGFAISPVQADSASYIKEVDNAVGATEHWRPAGRDAGGDDNVVVPEPGTLALLGLGLASLGAARKRRQSKES